MYIHKISRITHQLKLFRNEVFISYNGIIKYAINCYVIKEYKMYKKTRNG